MSIRDRVRDIADSRSFWIILVMLAGITLLHYTTPQMRELSPRVDAFLSRHAVERIAFILPVASATYAFGGLGGLATLAAAVLAMVPRAIWISPNPIDALMETGVAAVVGCIVVWMIETQANERRLREKAVDELEIVNDVAMTVSQSLDLDEILTRALTKVLEAREVVGPEPLGAVFLFDAEGGAPRLCVQSGFSSEPAVEHQRESSAELPLPLLSDLKEVIFSCTMASPVPWGDLESYAVVPLKARERVLGALLLSVQKDRGASVEHAALLGAIGSQIGVAIENALLYENLRFYARQITRTQEGERKRIAQELHDETIQMLIAISRRLEALAAQAGQLPAPMLRGLEQAQELTRSSIQGVRRFVQDLRPPILDHLGLIAALDGIVSDLREQDGLEVELHVDGNRQRLMPEAEMGLFRIVQEALSNVRRHSNASRVAVCVEFRPGWIRITVEDDGCGFSPPARIGELATTERLGLIGMYERARTLGGTISIQSEVGAGTKLTLDVPTQPGPHGANRPG